MEYSIIIPVYNYPLITETLDSIEEQIAEDKRFEIIVVDDASTDNTLERLKTHIEHNGLDNVRLLHHKKNKRQGGARNSALDIMGGYLLFF